MTSRASRRLGSNVLGSAALLALCAALVLPLLTVDVPPLLDYPNHLGRIFVLAALPTDPVLAQFYTARWSIIPNLALDLAGPPLLHVLPVHVAGRLLIAAALLLPVFGTVAYNTALGGRWWSLCVGLVAFNSCLLSGFLNFEIGLGVALLLAAAWLRWREIRPVRAVTMAMLGAAVLFACHLMGVVFFGLLIGSIELSRGVAGLLRRGAVLTLVFAVPAILYGLSDLRPLGGDAGFLGPGAKVLQLTTPFVNYNWLLDMVTAGVAITLPAMCLVLRWGRVPRSAGIAAVLLLATFAVAPFAWKGTFALDTRFAIMLGFMLFAGFIPERWPTWFRCTAAAALLVLLTARIALVTTAWAAHAADIADLRTVLALVQPGQTVYVAEASMNEAPAYWAANPRWRMLSNGARTDEHLGALVLIERRAYWPFEFDNVSQQPLKTREPYRGLAEKVGSLPDRARAAMADVCGFDYALLMAADAVSPLPANRFRLLAQSGFAALYGVTRCQADR
jgi:hypothetical protein